MAGKRRWLCLKSRKVRFCVRDPCAEYPSEWRTMCWRDHDVENANEAIRKENKSKRTAF